MADAVEMTAHNRAAFVPRLGEALPYVLVVFMAATFALPAGPDYALIFYVAVAPCTVAAIVTRTRIVFDASFVLTVTLIVWSGCTLFWGHDEGNRSLGFFRDTVCTLLYVLALSIVIAEPCWRGRLVRTLILAGTANALWSMALGWAFHSDAERLTGWGVTRHAILGASSMAIPYLLSLHRALSGRGTHWRRWRDGLPALTMATFILFTDSRGPLLAAAVGTFLLCAAGPWRRFALPGFALVVALWWAPSLPIPRFLAKAPPPAALEAEPYRPTQTPPAHAPAWLQPHSLDQLERRGTSHRLDIWAESIRLIRERPLFGHGLADNIHVDGDRGEVFTFPHDLYLSLLFYSGIVGLLLFAAIVLALALRLIRLRGRPEVPVLAALLTDALLAGLTDLGQITKGPGPIWIILWLPLILAMTTDATKLPD